MYTSFFNLKAKPFSGMPSSHFFYKGAAFNAGLEYLQNGFDAHKGMTAITGVAGAGKSTLVNMFLSGLNQQSVQVLRIYNAKLTVNELLAELAEQLKIKSNASKYAIAAHIERHIIEYSQSGGRLVICVDDAQYLPNHTFLELCKLASVQENKKKAALVILVGDTKLEQKPGMNFYQLGSLAEQEVEEYINYRMVQAGWNTGLPFESSTIKQINRYSQGIPEFVNILCDKLLLNAFLEQKTSSINNQDLELVLGELGEDSDAGWVSSQNDVVNSTAAVSIDNDSISLPSKPPRQEITEQNDETLVAPNGNKVLVQSELLLRVGSKLLDKDFVKINISNISESFHRLQRSIEEFRVNASDGNRSELDDSARSFYQKVLRHITVTSFKRCDLNKQECNAILSLRENYRYKGTVRILDQSNASKIISLANSNMRSVTLGVLASANNLESMYKEMTGFDVKFDASANSGVSVLLWRLSISSDMMLYMVGLPIEGAEWNEESYRLLGQLTSAVVIRSDQHSGLTKEEEVGLLSSLLLLGETSVQVVSLFSKQRQCTPYFFFQDYASSGMREEIQNLLPGMLLTTKKETA